ncbi:PREDICTED: adenosine 3'-phospho 5'-phosphosulfate transporter 2-like [Priapulus caudatus]|uniref:Adenosine 3'-phospho 5'-phosphosulfate transporter 2 n=1 Tax=Priapulus caudatus TaxID=37621 RepID=A0ABM1ESH9_PRICU|nr:PREDICTED: adenosine 3'-phospho 5'-phosphosulfate transporter 2-like [Priapulus caudatus]XP_014675151.1 PREDICTED: adenosine 3'-phospho 5'-phosphosulfate transporter 2-like [Priapulus caudatus]XP_014675152.1 PREDICTED: adenosine 3'-phospho 5'-phosphosulfate transporter 2-like [Priapulus caudatus]XP_014675153.1 PREDICTED: adenosine 3'-phospho 5'-phosphosulfate transporter 2-like [Priapulus caudatus]
MTLNDIYDQSSIVKHGAPNKDVNNAQNNETVISIGISTAVDAVPPTPPLVRILCLNLTLFPSWLQFVACSVGVFIFYLLYGYVQELIFRLEGFKPYGWYLTLVQFGFYTLFSYCEQLLGRCRRSQIPMRTYLLIALLTVSTMGLSNSSLGYLNYPTQVIFKCCKLIPVLLGGVVIQGKKYGWLDLLAAACMSAGLALFTLADSHLTPNFNLTGVALISLALCADAVIGNVQEKAMKMHHGSNTEMVLYSYGIGFVYILVGLTITGQLFEAASFCAEHPWETYGNAVVFSLTGYLGVNVVLTMVKLFGALATVTVTTFRKALTIMLSFVIFAKPFTFQYVWSGLIVLLGIYLNVYSKNRDKANVSATLLRVGGAICGALRRAINTRLNAKSVVGHPRLKTIAQTV